MARNEVKKDLGLSSFWLRMIGIAAMIWSFVTASDITPFTNQAVSDCMVWFSYTIFAFLLAEGVNKTTNRLLYLRRFAVFTCLTEFAYDFYKYGTYFNNKGQSVMFTLFICLVIMFICDYFKRRFRNIVLDVILIVSLSIAAINLTGLIHSEFGKYGVMIAMLFYTSYDLTYSRLFELAVAIAYSFYAKIDTIITITVNGLQYRVPITVFAFLALVVTWFYNEKRGPNKLWIKVSFYLVYPVLLLVFFFLEKYLFIGN
jgi:hypothetical protein